MPPRGNEADGLYYDAGLDGRLSPVKAASGFLPLLLDDLPSGRATRLAAMLNDPRQFATAFPVPSLAISEPTWSTDMWRGATWLNFNYLIILGLRRHGLVAEAARLKERTLHHVRKYYEQAGVIFEFYDAKDMIRAASPDAPAGPLVGVATGEPTLAGAGGVAALGHQPASPEPIWPVTGPARSSRRQRSTSARRP